MRKKKRKQNIIKLPGARRTKHKSCQ